MVHNIMNVAYSLSVIVAGGSLVAIVTMVHNIMSYIVFEYLPSVTVVSELSVAAVTKISNKNKSIPSIIFCEVVF